DPPHPRPPLVRRRASRTDARVSRRGKEQRRPPPSPRII
ncbi:MAG: hypothetical protein AVDCRST_MAG49-2917, partial [uncultured Thermomicrobiales bacterium]